MLFIWSYSKYWLSSEGLRQYTTFELPQIEWSRYLRCGERCDLEIMNGSEIVITNLCVGQVGTAQVHLIKKKVVNKFCKSSLGGLRTLLTIRTDYRFLTSTKWSLTGSSFGKINLWSSSWKFSKDPFVLVTSLPLQCTIRMFSGVLFIYAPPMKYWVTIDLKIPTFSADTNCKWWNKSERYDFWGVGIETRMKKAD